MDRGALKPGEAEVGEAPKAPPEDPVRGILLHATATILFATADTTAKYLSLYLPVVEILWIRYLIFLMFAVGLAYRFAAVPDRWTLLGAAIVIGSGLYTAHREWGYGVGSVGGVRQARDRA